jgi:hypothetical protein
MSAGEGVGVGDDVLLVVLELGVRASPNATALAATMCMSGPPCTPGNSARLVFL